MDLPQATPNRLAPLLSEALDPLFWRPSRLGVESAWTGHVPFAHWIVAAARPRVLVELGTHRGVSYTAFCDAVLAAGLDTRCFAVDTWEGDAHAGFYDESIYTELRRFHDQRFAGFSELLRCTFDDALRHFGDGSIDLLHIDGCHGYDAVRHDYESWRPRLSPRAVVLFHDTNVRERDFGVWRLFAELRAQHPGFEFVHEHGLGVLAVGPAVPEPVAALCALDDPAAIAAVRRRFSLLGERWQAEERVWRAAQDAAATANAMRARAARHASAARAAAAVALADFDRLKRDTGARLAELQNAATEAARLRLEVARTHAALKRAEALEAEAAHHRRSAVFRIAARVDRLAARIPPPLRLRSAQAARVAGWMLRLQLRRQWRRRAQMRRDLQRLAASPLFDPGWYSARYPDVAASGMDPAVHYLLHGGREGRHPGPEFDAAHYLAHAPDVAAAGADPLLHYLDVGRAEGRATRPVPPSPAPADPPSVTAALTVRRVALISGEPETPGHVYRVARFAAAAERLGAVATWMRVEEIGPRRDEIVAADLLMIWRATWPQIASAVATARENGIPVAYDLDDLMTEPDLATPELLDALRSEGIAEADARGHYDRIREAVLNADICTASTEELATHLRRLGKPVLVLPNGFDAATLRRARNAARARRQEAGDGLLRLGYAAGSRTHQRDFAVIADVIGDLLRTRAECRLVLFRSHIDGLPLLDPAEHPALAGCADRIEWRTTVDVAALPQELARFDVNLAPLEAGNPFCEAKSELKHFEAAMAGVVTVASPTGPFRRAIDDGRTGFLAHTGAEWHAAITRLLDDPDARRRMADAALRDVLWRHGPERRCELVGALFDQIAGGRTGARSAALDMQLAARPAPPPPFIPDGRVLFAQDRLDDAAVTVIVPLHNYAQYVTEALESVAAQTLGLLDLVVVDDASTDASRDIALAWAQQNAGRFNRLLVIANEANAGLGPTRNAGFAAAETPYVLPLDADNRLRPACCARLLEAARAGTAAFVYPVLQEFGEQAKQRNVFPYAPVRLIGVPHIDATALIARAAWAAAGGYGDSRLGWEDYEFWCRLAEQGLYGAQLAGEPLAEYRVHGDSLLLATTETQAHKPAVMAEMTRRHPWLRLVPPRGE
jgi:glycosyltransferase involved in cell wall biosynthesis